MGDISICNLTTLCLNGTLPCVDFLDVITRDIGLPKDDIAFWLENIVFRMQNQTKDWPTRKIRSSLKTYKVKFSKNQHKQRLVVRKNFILLLYRGL